MLSSDPYVAALTLGDKALLLYYDIRDDVKSFVLLMD